MNELDKNIDVDTEDFEPRIYEIGYHIIPTVAEDNLSGVTKTVKEAVEVTSGAVISEGEPNLVDLAYSMDHIVANKKTIFDSAYFGWVKFEGNPENILKIKDSLDKNENILRFLIIKTVKEDTLPKKTGSKTTAPEEKKVKEIIKDKKEVVSKEVDVDKKEVVSKEVDKAIEELVA